jgi:hypothetical protein
VLLKKYKIWLVAFSLLWLAAGCKNGPKIVICVVDVANKGYQCVDKKEKEFFLPFELSDNYIAIPPEDAKTLLDYCKSKDK